MIQETAVSPLLAWASFYVILGSAAAALTGLMFVVISLIANARPRTMSQPTDVSIGAFSTPTVVHFCLVLLVSAILSAPWQALSNAGIMLGLAGLGGMAYSLIAIRRLQRQAGYRPILEDWLCYGILPLLAYAALLVAAIMLPRRPVLALFGIGAIMIVLLFLGIRNAWDSVTYITLMHMQPQNERKE